MSDKAMQSAPVATAKATYIRIAPRKVQIVLDLIRNQPADKAMAILKYTPKAACEPLMKLLKSAIANAENNNNMDPARLYVAECSVSQGPTLKRIRPRAHGRAFRINKKTSHINLVLKEME
ncbi:MAG: 50S ribosomal protein L22 [Oscillospiraceae bacterium]|nr:50S ribosomal protein L22 [Oscillospiraceae bacterium]